jgi:hypothetical protein
MNILLTVLNWTEAEFQYTNEEVRNETIQFNSNIWKDALIKDLTHMAESHQETWKWQWPQ